ncbi:hypothetical protein BU17DRAFT_81165 [Hysterangium stoloniferum]|nr:hypothetical protein BU17DRAFT_81165 [Hysterangium stoloniferum]
MGGHNDRISLGSDTETEDENDEAEVAMFSIDYTDRTPLFTSQELGRTAPISAQVTELEVLQSIKLLETHNKDYSNPKKNSLSTPVYAALSTLLAFLEYAITYPVEQRSFDPAVPLSRILRSSFFTRLFELRLLSSFNKGIREGICTSERAYATAPSIDILLVRISETILAVSGRGAVVQARAPQEAALDDFLNCQSQKEQLVRVASQLPGYFRILVSLAVLAYNERPIGTWKKTITSLPSEDISEASRRLALSLVFGVFVLHPRLCSERPEILPERKLLEESLKKYLLKISHGVLNTTRNTQLPTDCGFFPQDAVALSHYSLIIALFAVTIITAIAIARLMTLLQQLEMTKEDDTCTVNDFFHPSSSYIIITMLDLVMAQKTSDTFEKVVISWNIDQNQRRLLDCSLMVPWCWKSLQKGDDTHLERVAYVRHGSITRVRTRSKCMLNQINEILNVASTVADMEAHMKLFNIGALATFIHLTAILTHDESNSVAASVLYKVVWCLFHAISSRDHMWLEDDNLGQICETMFGLVCSLGFSVMECRTHDLATESILWFPQPVATKALKSFTPSNLLQSIMDNIVNIIVSKAFTVENNKKLRTFLHVLTIITSIDATFSDVLDNRLFTSQIISLVGHYSDWDLPTQQSALLFLGCLADKIPRILHPDQTAIICTSILSNASSNDFSLGNAIAVYVHAAAQVGFHDTAPLFEVWDYLRDLLLLMLKDAYLECPISLASKIKASICVALSIILTSLPHNQARTLLCSPWTAVMYKELWRAYPELSISTDEPFVRELVDQIHSMTSEDDELRLLCAIE